MMWEGGWVLQKWVDYTTAESEDQRQENESQFSQEKRGWVGVVIRG